MSVFNSITSIPYQSAFVPVTTYGSVLLNNAYVGNADRSLGAGYFASTTRPSGGFIPSGSLSDFTIEAWIYPMWFSYSGGFYNMVIMSNHNGSGSYGFEFKLQGPSASRWTSLTLRNQRISTDYQFPININGSGLNQWYHVAIVYSTSGGSLTGYLNGDLLSTISPSYFTEPSNALTVGYNYASYPYWFKGKLTNLRISKTARYNGSFTPSTSPNSVDSYDTFLMNMPTSNVFQEETGRTITTYGGSPSVITSSTDHP